MFSRKYHNGLTNKKIVMLALMQGKKLRVSTVSDGLEVKYCGKWHKTRTTELRKIISQLGKTMLIRYKWQPNSNNKGQHKVYYI